VRHTVAKPFLCLIRCRPWQNPCPPPPRRLSLHIGRTSQPWIFTVGYELGTSSQLHIFTATHLHSYTSSQLHSFTATNLHSWYELGIFSAAHLHSHKSSQLVMSWASSQLHIFTATHLHCYTSSLLHIFTATHLHRRHKKRGTLLTRTAQEGGRGHPCGGAFRRGRSRPERLSAHPPARRILHSENPAHQTPRNARPHSLYFRL
jgi:hypothetical protein